MEKNLRAILLKQKSDVSENFLIILGAMFVGNIIEGLCWSGTADLLNDRDE